MVGLTFCRFFGAQPGNTQPRLVFASIFTVRQHSLLCRALY